MRKIHHQVILAILMSLSASAQKSEWITLLRGYSLQRTDDGDTFSATIKKVGRPTIEFEAGPSAGPWVDSRNIQTFSWYQEQVINGRKVRIALTKPGVRTPWEPEGTKVPGNVLLVTIMLGKDNEGFAANFSSKVRTSQDIADLLLMAVTFDISKMKPDR